MATQCYLAAIYPVQRYLAIRDGKAVGPRTALFWAAEHSDDELLQIRAIGPVRITVIRDYIRDNVI